MTPRWSRTNQLIAAAASRLGGRAEPLTRTSTDYFVRLVHGERSAIVSKTRSPFLTQVAQSLSNNKKVSRELLGARGLPVPPDLLVDETGDPRGSEITSFLRRYGEVVVKPNWGNRGAGVTPAIRDAGRLARACARARDLDLDEEALIEPHLAGVNLRIAVVGGEAIAAAEIERPRLEGDGRRGAAALVDALNQDPRRGSWRSPTLVTLDVIEPEEDLLGHLEVLGHDLEAPLPAGLSIEITGEESEVIDRSEEVDPGWLRLAERAAAILGVDVGGVDLRGPLADFLAPPRAGADAWRRGALLEVNVLPALHYHALPTRGAPRPVFEAFVAYCLQLPGAPAIAATIDAGRR
ncbi:MAG: hypothetical protein R3B09_31550 [Nannocystaceae bacterium]